MIARAMIAQARVPVALAAALLIGGCAAGGAGRNGDAPGAPRGGNSETVPFDSATVFLWRFEETGGTRVVGEGPDAVTGTVGTETRPDLGRVGGGRRFTRSIDSFAWSAYAPRLEATREMTIEAWIRVDAFGQYEDTPIAGRWNPANADQSWLLAVGGENLEPPLAALPSPGYHKDLIQTGFQNRSLGRLMFAFQPERASLTRAYFSNERIEVDRWTHVAAVFDSKVLRLYLNGELDAQFAVGEGIRATSAPLLVGNLFDPRDLTSFGGDLRVGDQADRNPYYAFQGVIDELRLSRVARAEFPNVR